MSTILVPLSEERLERLRELAIQLNLTPETLAGVGLESWLTRPHDDFASTVDYVMRKNAELYRRLA